LPSNLILPGYLVENDDFNDHAPPYNFVRPNGRRGSCFANSYRLGGQFLLLLKKRSSEYTVNWYSRVQQKRQQTPRGPPAALFDAQRKYAE